VATPRQGEVRAGTAREAVFHVVADQAARFPELALVSPETAGLEPRDAALAHAIYDAVIRRWITLTHVIDSVLNQPLRMTEAGLQSVLLCGAAQLLLLDRLPDHAVINESVELAKRHVRPGAGGLTNAVLRKVASLRAGPPALENATKGPALPLADGRQLPLKQDVLPTEPAQRLAALTSHSHEIVNEWMRRFPADVGTMLAHHSLVNPPTILNTTHVTSAMPTTVLPHRLPGHHVFTGSHTELRALLASRGDLWVQDPASSRAVAAAGRLNPSLIVDVCAGQGTKTRQLAAQFPNARIVATDVDPERFRTLMSVFRGSAQVRVVPISDLAQCSGSAELVVLDVPCSNLGVLARRPEAKYRPREAQLKRLQGIQRQIVADSIQLLTAKPKGRLLYSTCSIDPEENEAQAAWAKSWHGLAIERSETLLPSGAPGDDAASYHDGSFFALLG
jgi:16S rRNA (cytosine967-C5)-methyltransferase